MDMEKLAAEAAVAVVKELAKSGVQGGVAAGGKIWAWIKGKAPDADKATIDAVEAAPEKPSASDKVSGVLKDLLHGNPDLQAELAKLVEENGGGRVVQTSTIAGDENAVAQVAGNKNKVNIGR